jgi:hypothetical protein
VTDVDEIIATMSGYCHSIDDRRFDDLAALMTDDVRFEMGEDVTQTRDDFIKYVLANIWPAGRHVCYNPEIDVAGDRATAVSDWLFLDGKLSIVSAGRYADEFTRVNGRWRFAVRRITTFASASA